VRKSINGAATDTVRLAETLAKEFLR